MPDTDPTITEAHWRLAYARDDTSPETAMHRAALLAGQDREAKRRAMRLKRPKVY